MFERTLQGAVQIISGDVSLTGEHLGKAEVVFAQCIARGQPQVVLHLDRVPLVDSAGLEWVLDCRDRCIARGGALRLAAPTRLWREILHATGLEEQMQVFDDVIEAVGSFAR
jgi:anti-sigma B factor antagonist